MKHKILLNTFLHSRFNYNKFLWIYFLIFILTLPVQADTIVFKDGQIKIGKILSQTRTTLTMESESGKNVIKKEMLQRITYDKLWEEKKKKDKEEADRLKKEKEANEAAAREKKKADEIAASEQQKLLEQKKQQEELAAKEVERQAQELQAKLKEKRSSLLLRENILWAQLHKDYSVGPKAEEKQAEELPPVVEKSGYTDTNATTPGILKRNAVLPGWGHNYAGYNKSSYALSGIFAVSFINAFYARQSFLTLKNKFDKDALVIFSMGLTTAFDGISKDPFAKLLLTRKLDAGAYKKFDKSSSNLNLALIEMGVIYAGILIHSFFIKPSAAASSSAETFNPIFSMAVTPIPAQNTSLSSQEKESLYFTGAVNLRF